MTSEAAPTDNRPDKILAACIGEEPPPCQAACPLDIRVREQIRLMQEGKMTEALAVVLERCPFPGILGRICTAPCEPACTRNALDQPLAIRLLKRRLADLDPEAALRVLPGPERPQAVAVVGGGPAGLMAAYELRHLGYPVTLFEAEAFLGGALRLYIPPYRLPREVLDREICVIEKLGVEVRLRTRLGRDVQLEELRRQFPAVFLAVGCHKSLLLEAAGETLSGVWYGLDFLRAANSGAPPQVGAQVAVVGGGNTALDAARSARRLGARHVTLIYRRSRDEMPASPAEIAAAGEEGVELLHHRGVKAILGRHGRVAGLQLKEVDRSREQTGGAPVYIEDRLSELEADTAILAVGQTADFRFFGPGLGFDTSSKARLDADPVCQATRIPGVFAGGDLATGPGSAVAAFAAGRRAAFSIHAFLQQEPLPADLLPRGGRATTLVVDTTGVTPAPRLNPESLDLEARLGSPGGEVEQGYNDTAARAEADRCLVCACSRCVRNCTFLQHYVKDFPPTQKGMVRVLADRGLADPRIPYSCHQCGLCQVVCPQGLHAGQVCLEYRERLAAAGQGPLPQHQSARNYVKWGTSPTFTLSRPDPATGRAARVFFPGCSLPGHSPHLVRAAYDYLRARLPDTGIMLNCCGAPSQLLGEREVLAGVVALVDREMEKLGAKELICACAYCQQTLGEQLPELKIRSLYEMMLEMDLPEGCEAGAAGVVNIHDPCGARGTPRIHDAVRRLVAAAGLRVEEMAHSRERSLCCGSGGLASAVAPDLARKLTELRISEATGDLVTYCAACRSRFAKAGHPALHVLELLFNPAGCAAAKTAPPAGSWRRWWRRWRLKRYFQDL